MTRRLNFGGDPFGDDGPPQTFVNPMGVVELQGAYPPPPVEPNYPQQKGSVQITEPVVGWWRQKGAFGFAFNGMMPGEDQVIPLTEQLNLPGPPREWWIHWFRSNRNSPGEFDTFNAELRGRITYGVGGIQNVVEVDVISGVQMPLVANSLKVELVTYNPVTGAVYVPGTVIAGATFGDGSGGGALPPTWTSSSMVVPLGVDLNVDFALPDFARSLCLHTSIDDPAVLNDVFLTFVSGNGTTLKSVRVDRLYAELTREKGIAIPAGTNVVNLLAPQAHAGQRFSLQFFLAL